MISGKVLKDKRLISSHLALRFYRKYGWTEESVKAVMIKGSLRFFPDEIKSINEDTGEVTIVDLGYWVGNVGTQYDTKKLLAIAGPVFHYDQKTELKGDHAADFIESMNW